MSFFNFLILFYFITDGLLNGLCWLCQPSVPN